MKKSYFLSIIIFIVLFFATAWMSVGIGTIVVFIDFPSMLLVLLCSIVLLLSNYSLSEIRKYFSIGFKEKTDPIDIKNGIVFFSALQKYLILSGMLGTFTGMIAMLALLDDPGKIGSSMSLALLTALYAIALSMIVAIPFKTGLQRRLNEISK